MLPHHRTTRVGVKPKQRQFFAKPGCVAFSPAARAASGPAVGAEIATALRSRARDSAARTGRFF